jgi:hypothetical protein
MTARSSGGSPLPGIPARLLLIFLLALPGRASGEDFYWDLPALFSEVPGRFPVSASNGDFSVVAWQESSPLPGGGEIRVSAAFSAGGGNWRIQRSLGGPYPYTGTEPAILSAALDRRGRIVITAAAAAGECEILLSGDRGQSFSRRRVEGGDGSVAPRAAFCSDGTCLIFITRGSGRSLSIYYSYSGDGENWSPFARFAEEALPLSFLPAHGALGSSDFVVFQSLLGGDGSQPGFQLFIKQSEDGGRTWGPSRLLTDFREGSLDPFHFDNQRPSLAPLGDGLFLAWERRYQNGSPRIYGAEIDAGGGFRGPAWRISREEAYCNNPSAFSRNGEPMVAWFDNRAGENRAYLARRGEGPWLNRDLSGPAGDLAFVRPALAGGEISFFYQSVFRGQSRIFGVFPDRSAPAPAVRALNFRPGLGTPGDTARLSWEPPQDPSGIAGYSWLWSRDPGEEPERALLSRGPAPRTLEFPAGEEGSWYFSVICRDQAGNWSGPGRAEYIRDATPPPAVSIIPPETDGEGFLLSNTFSLRWTPSPAPDLAGYARSLRYLGPAGSAGDGSSRAGEEPGGFPSPELSASYSNQDDGAWIFSVAAVDQAGNRSPPSSLVIRTNKQLPQIRISRTEISRDEDGLVIRILGAGFSRGGEAGRIFLDRDGEYPYDREYFLSRGDYRILSDQEITELRAGDLNPGRYRLGLEHPLGGIVLAESPLDAEAVLPAKFGEFSRSWTPSWRIRPPRPLAADPEAAFLALVLAFSLAGILVILRGIQRALSDFRTSKTEILALFGGDFMPLEKKKHLTAVKRQGLGLRFKLAAFTIVLVLLVVSMVSAPLYYMMTWTQESTLLGGLKNRSQVLLDGLATSVRAYLSEKNVMQLGFLPNQISAIPEARYLTITGSGEGGRFSDQVWASNDPDILLKIDTEELQPGVSLLRDLLSPRLELIGGELNRAAGERAGELSQAISGFTSEAVEIANSLDPESRRRFEDIQVSIRSLEARLTEELAEINREIGSEPAFPTDRIDREGDRFIFFKPVLYRQGQGDLYFRGLIRLEVSVSSIHDQIAQDQAGLLRIILLVALIALAMGTVGALTLSSLIIRPITRLVSHVEQIRDTEDKSKLAGLEIGIKTHDEIAVLGRTINDMTHGLVKAAIAASDLSIGKEVQKKFIPLELDSRGDKLSTGFQETGDAEFFGYYEGAKGVSGDYFDYQNLDGRYFAIIKCDVAGKGIPAALIMIQVATMFLNYFKQWKPGEKGMRIEELVYSINDFIEPLGFKDRFAAFILCLFDSQTGLLRICNAGDNVIRFFDASEKRMKTLALRESPATGVFPNAMVRARNDYAVSTMNLDHGDVLFLYTDGIEEAKRRFRDAEFREITCSQGAPGSPHENHLAGQKDEEMGADRVEAIINAVMNREIYILHKWHNPEGNGADLSFDFTGCQGKMEEAIMALVSVEKIFRCYKNPLAGEDSRVLVDKKLDAFLRSRFVQYRNYCSRTRENPGNDAYMYYTHLSEDEQYDDLTILGIGRK